MRENNSDFFNRQFETVIVLKFIVKVIKYTFNYFINTFSRSTRVKLVHDKLSNLNSIKSRKRRESLGLDK